MILSRSRVTLLSSAFLIVANLVPLAMLRRGGWAPGDVLISYWLENVVVGGFGLIRILTARAPQPGTSPVLLGGFFVFHFGIFTLVHGAFTIFIAAVIGLSSSVQSWIYVAAGLLVSHAVSLAFGWFGDGERNRTTPSTAMWQPYQRVVILHIVVLASVFILATSVSNGLGTGGLDSSIRYRAVPAVLLIVIKTTVDLVVHLRLRRDAPATTGRAPVAPAV